MTMIEYEYFYNNNRYSRCFGGEWDNYKANNNKILKNEIKSWKAQRDTRVTGLNRVLIPKIIKHVDSTREGSPVGRKDGRYQ